MVGYCDQETGNAYRFVTLPNLIELSRQPDGHPLVSHNLTVGLFVRQQRSQFLIAFHIKPHGKEAELT